ncbi:MAG: ABC transporter ATP-binding protein [Terriglobales bacterium]
MDLHLENLAKRFAGKVAVEIPALTIRQREFFTFVGPSGCGKSTTLNLIAGLEEPTEGSIQLGERRLNELPPHQRDVAFVFQSYALYPHRTVFGNLAFPLKLAGVPAEELRRRVSETAELLGLTPLLEKRPRQLSGGERQRVALGRAMVRQPQLFLFDEPLSNLDAPLRAQMRRELRRLHQHLGTTFIYVTHDQEEALSLSDRIAVMQSGRIQQCGSPRELYEKPASTFVASFFGSPAINLLETEWGAEAGASGVRVRERLLPIQRGSGPSSGTSKVILGIRPEHIRLSREPQADGWSAQVVLVEPHGGLHHIELDLAGVRLTAVEHWEAGFRPGDKVWLHLPADRVHLFDAHTGRCLDH